MWGWFLSETPKTSPKDDGFGLGGDFVFEKHKERTCNDMCAKDIYIVNILNYEDISLYIYMYMHMHVACKSVSDVPTPLDLKIVGTLGARGYNYQLVVGGSCEKMLLRRGEMIQFDSFPKMG